uniref:Uncharacterized protein n=1 Tax=Arundo donax TaxID=35708 RepID=A0A0A9BCA8_ARUDO
MVKVYFKRLSQILIHPIKRNGGSTNQGKRGNTKGRAVCSCSRLGLAV